MYKFLFLLLIAVSNISNAAIYYVAPTGNDSSNGSLSTPFKTISKGINVSNPGDSVQVRTGTYLEKISIWKSGTSTAPITIENYLNEKPVLDGIGLPKTNWTNVVDIGGNYITFSGFEVRNVNTSGSVLGGYAFYVTGKNVTIKNNYVHDVWDQGMVICGDNDIVDNNIITKTAQSSLKNLPWPTTWAYGLGIQAVYGTTTFPQNIIVRNNRVFYNGGEGIISIKTISPIIENNITYDNLAVNLYITDTTNAIVRNNLVYATQKSNELFQMPARGLGVANEYNTNLNGNIGNLVYNNIVYGTAYPFVYFTQPATGGIQQFKDSLIAYNVFMNATSGRGAGSISTINISGGGVSNVRFMNNIIIQEDNNPIFGGSSSGIAFSSNIWSKSPNILLSVYDKILDPKLAKINDITDPNYFSVLNTSPAIKAGINLPEIQTDFFSKTRSNPSTIGAIEYGINTTPVPTPTPNEPVSNLVLGKSSSSSIENSSLSSNYAFDNNPKTRWSSSFANNQWLSVDLGKVYNIKNVVLNWETAYAKEYKIQFSNDNSTWNDAYYTNTSKGGLETIPVVGYARYVRIYCITRATQWGFSLWDVQVNGFEDSLYNNLIDYTKRIFNINLKINQSGNTYEMPDQKLIVIKNDTNFTIKSGGVEIGTYATELEVVREILYSILDQLII